MGETGLLKTDFTIFIHLSRSSLRVCILTLSKIQTNTTKSESFSVFSFRKKKQLTKHCDNKDYSVCSLQDIHDDIENEFFVFTRYSYMRRSISNSLNIFSSVGPAWRDLSEGMMERLLDYMIWIKPWVEAILLWLNLPGMSLRVKRWQ